MSTRVTKVCFYPTWEVLAVAVSSSCWACAYSLYTDSTGKFSEYQVLLVPLVFLLPGKLQRFDVLFLQFYVNSTGFRIPGKNVLRARPHPIVTSFRFRNFLDVRFVLTPVFSYRFNIMKYERVLRRPQHFNKSKPRT
jgi:hypothetical protein